MKKVNIVRGCIENGKFVPYEETRKKVDVNTADNYLWATRDDAFDYIEDLGGKSHMFKDHLVYAAKLFNPQGGLKEIHFITHGRDLNDDEFQEFIKPYGFVGAIHR